MFTFWLGSALAADCNSVPVSNKAVEIQVAQISDLVDQHKGCWTVLELWALWCPPCLSLKPELEKLRKKHSNVRFLSISADNDHTTLSQYLQSHPAQSRQFRLAQWSTESLASEFTELGAHFTSTVPYFVVFKPDGSIVGELTEPENLNKISALLES